MKRLGTSLIFNNRSMRFPALAVNYAGLASSTRLFSTSIKEINYTPYTWVTKEAEHLIAKAYNRHKTLGDKAPEFPPCLSIKDKEDMEKLEAPIHYPPKDFVDRIALNLMRFLRVFTHGFFRKKYDHHAVVLETVAAVPGICAAFHRHLRSLRNMERDHGWINPLLEEAENERMHLLIWMTMIKPTRLERSLVILAQGTYLTFYSLLYFTSPRAAHRLVGYLEEEAHLAYTAFLKAIDDGEIPNKPAPEIAKKYYRLPEDATLRDVVLCVRADECMHRDFNHMLGDRHYHGLANQSPDFMKEDLREKEALGPQDVYKDSK